MKYKGFRVKEVKTKLTCLGKVKGNKFIEAFRVDAYSVRLKGKHMGYFNSKRDFKKAIDKYVLEHGS